ncbi:unnamed protein product [Pseudo-nitzschia multistriata]|uniref:Protease Do-like PDZ domain-containing protein n=1 Tax=Pseudo-nitzschia multistriata TaxID=183589 RepID=A0A448ZPP2_9STRA|nr:unnamed protein product [Pseudo-nitzschia multistriata]
MKGLPFLAYLFSIAINSSSNNGSGDNILGSTYKSNKGNGGFSSSNNDPMSIKGNGVCLVEVARVEWNPIQPWQRSPQSKSSGTAFVIEGEQLLTNAHVVKSAIDIRVRPHGSTRRFPAQVVCYAPDVDLALLELVGESEKADFFGHPSAGEADGDEEEERIAKRRRTTKSLEFATELPGLQETVHVVGFPTGGRTICVTEGVVSRIDLYNRIVAIQVDSAINPGNSGGPAFNSKGQVTGVAFRKRISTKSQKVDNIGYLIPAVLVRAFLGRVDREKGTYQLSGTIPYRCHSLENHSLRLAHGVPDFVHGILITSVADAVTESTEDGTSAEESPLQLQPGDILTKIDDSPVADDGQVVLRGDELIHHAYLMRIKQKDESVIFTVYRGGKHIVCDPYFLKDIQPIIPRWGGVDYMPNYLILGSLVLLPLFLELKNFKQCGHLLKADCIQSYWRWPREWEGKEGLVVLTEIFAHELSFSYSRPWRRVVSYNGEKIKSLGHLQKLWNASCSTVTTSVEQKEAERTLTFVRLELENDDDIVFEVEAAMKAQEEVMATHAISKPYNILPRNPNYI